jgi:OTU domain-containing protein 5
MVRFNKDENNKRTIVRTNNGPFVSPTPNTNQRTERNISNRNESGYNSDDERRPRSIVRKIDDEGVKHVTVDQLRVSLAKKGLEIVTMPPDGNCLFHSVADQIYGDHEYHDVVRNLCLDYMQKERGHFSQFVTEDFDAYIARKRQLAVHGNHLELQAITEIYSRPVEIYAIDENPLNIFQGSYEIDSPPIMLSYHYGNHYNSVRDPLKPTAGFGLGLPGLKTAKEVDIDNLNEAIKESERDEIDKIIAENTENDFDNVEERLMDLVKKESGQMVDQDLENSYMQQFMKQSELDIMQEAIERSIMEQSIREYYSKK